MRIRQPLLATYFLVVLLVSSVSAQRPQLVSGFNLSLPPIPGQHIQVPFEAGPNHWQLDVDLIFDPAAPPMEKWFQSPQGSAGPILLDGLQPLPFPVWENFYLIPPIPGIPPGAPVSDWHEHIHTPGWEWVIPGDPRFPDLFPPGQSLITRNGEPWPWEPLPHPGGTHDPAALWVKFPPIGPAPLPTGMPPILDIHKALLWVGTDDNRIWGDGVDNAGNTIDESMIKVWEYPTPEPSTLALLLLLAIGMSGFAKRDRMA